MPATTVATSAPRHGEHRLVDMTASIGGACVAFASQLTSRVGGSRPFPRHPGRQHRREENGEQKRAGERESISLRHRRKDFSRHALHGEKRNQRDDNHQDGKSTGRTASAVASAIRSKMCCVRSGCLQAPVDIFEHDHGSVHENAEIDRADGNQVGGAAVRIPSSKTRKAANTESSARRSTRWECRQEKR